VARVGICRQLHAFHHYRLWQTFLEELGFEVVLSAKTTRTTVELGVRVAPAELCLPVKAFLGHVQQLSGMVDILFLPRLVCYRLGHDWFFGCPKALALPDLTRALFSGLRDVELVIDERRFSLERAFGELAGRLGAGRKEWREALRKARLAAVEADARIRADGSPRHLFEQPTSSVISTEEVRRPSGEIPLARAKRFLDSARNDRRGSRIGVIGHQYLVFDDVLTLGILDRLRQCGAEVVVHFPDCDELTAEARLGNAPNWFYELELLAAARSLLQQRSVDGILLLSSFACGTAPVTNEIIRREVEKGTNIPTLTLLLDEHTAEAGLITRLESFVDLLTVKRS